MRWKLPSSTKTPLLISRGIRRCSSPINNNETTTNKWNMNGPVSLARIWANTDRTKTWFTQWPRVKMMTRVSLAERVLISRAKKNTLTSHKRLRDIKIAGRSWHKTTSFATPNTTTRKMSSLWFQISNSIQIPLKTINLQEMDHSSPLTLASLLMTWRCMVHQATIVLKTSSCQIPRLRAINLLSPSSSGQKMQSPRSESLQTSNSHPQTIWIITIRFKDTLITSLNLSLAQRDA